MLRTCPAAPGPTTKSQWPQTRSTVPAPVNCEPGLVKSKTVAAFSGGSSMTRRRCRRCAPPLGPFGPSDGAMSPHGIQRLRVPRRPRLPRVWSSSERRSSKRSPSCAGRFRARWGVRARAGPPTGGPTPAATSSPAAPGSRSRRVVRVGARVLRAVAGGRSRPCRAEGRGVVLVLVRPWGSGEGFGLGCGRWRPIRTLLSAGFLPPSCASPWPRSGPWTS